MSRWRVGAAGVVVVALVAALWAWTSPLWGAARPGEVFEARARPAGRTVEVITPVVPLSVTVGEPVREIDADEQSTGLLKDRRTERGDRIVPVSWQVRSKRSPGSGILPRLTLVTEDGRHRLPTSDHGGGFRPSANLYVVVRGRAERVRVEVEFDGVVQVADMATGKVDAGVAAAYYEDPNPVRFDKGECTYDQPAGADGPNEVFTCSLGETALTPYLADVGWVENEGDQWLTVPIEEWAPSTMDVSEGDAYALYRMRPGARTTLLGGAEPVAVLDEMVSGETTRATYVFAVDGKPGELVVRRSHRGTLVLSDGQSAGGAPRSVRVDGELRARIA